MKSNSFYVIQGWMINELQLKGNELLVFAVIYGFSKDSQGKFEGSLKYLTDSTGASRNTVINTLNSLLEKKLILKENITLNNITFCKYFQNELVVQKLHGGSTIFDKLGSTKIAPNNIINNNINNNNKPTVKKKFSFFESLIDLGVEKQIVNDWLAVRKTKKLTNTKTAFKNLLIEFEKSGKPIAVIIEKCVTNSWGGFKASWNWESENKTVLSNQTQVNNDYHSKRKKLA